jgi:glycerophosphoryl diester phosphodiesterase
VKRRLSGFPFSPGVTPQAITATAPFLSGPLPLCFAHRGGAAVSPENTLQAFGSASRAGLALLETDVRMSRDGELVLFHDERLERTTNGHGLVRDKTLAELKGLDAAFHFAPAAGFPLRGQGVCIPTLFELIEACPSARINIEIKEQGRPDLPSALFRFIVRHGLEDRLLVAAEQHTLMVQFRQLAAGRVATSASKREVLAFWAHVHAGFPLPRVLPFVALQVPVRAFGLRFLTPVLLSAARRCGLHVHAWTINDVAEMQELMSMGVQGIMTDYPERLARTVADWGESQATVGTAKPTGAVERGSNGAAVAHRESRGGAR